MGEVVEMVAPESGSFGAALVWEVGGQVVSGAEIRILPGRLRPFLVVAIRPSGNRLVAGRLSNFADAWSLGEAALEVMETELAA